MKKNIFIFIFTIKIFLISLIAVEVIAYYLYENSYKTDDSIPPLYWSSLYKHVTTPQRRSFFFPIVDDPGMQAFYKEVHNSSIQDGLRFTPDNNLKGSQHILFFGCSYTFGVGVDDNETMPFYFAQTVENSRVYNFGLPGFGPAETLSLLQRRPFYSNYEETKDLPVIGVFTFISDHINRVALNFSHVFHTPLDNLIEYRLEGEKIVGGGYLFDENFPKFLFFSILKRSKLFRILMIHERRKWEELNAIGIHEEFEYSPEDILLTLNVLKEMESAFKRLYPKGRFFVYGLAPDIGLIDEYEKLGGSTFGAQNFFSTQKYLPDGHYTPDGLKDLSRFIIKNLQQKGLLTSNAHN